MSGVPGAGDVGRVERLARAHAAACDGFVFAGGDDPRTERYGEPTHPRANPVHPDRQAYEEALLRVLDEPAFAHKPVLGVCLGMQMMALHRGGSLVQHMPDEIPTHADHMDDRVHEIEPCETHAAVRGGAITSWHRQCVRSAGSMRIVARAPDGVIEAIDDPARAFYVGVQWHPERTRDAALGDDVFRALVGAVRGA
ncbi:MAG: gamma-glutamyl-gamma-aminobutyrate hydrolase family protein [Phycisphaerales bacterium]|nr:MAG: gamma-glutamyl-gamma-aminobutyrate hydrolase family protein [Phycisphaerales bacterium]